MDTCSVCNSEPTTAIHGKGAPIALRLSIKTATLLHYRAFEQLILIRTSREILSVQI